MAHSIHAPYNTRYTAFPHAFSSSDALAPNTYFHPLLNPCSRLMPSMLTSTSSARFFSDNLRETGVFAGSTNGRKDNDLGQIGVMSRLGTSGCTIDPPDD